MTERVGSTTEIEIPAFRGRQAVRALRPYDVILPDDEWAGHRPQMAREVLDGVWNMQNMPAVPVIPPIDWDAGNAQDRSWNFWLHCWQPVASLLSAHSNTGEAPYLQRALEIALDWIGQHPSFDPSSSFAWYDMAVGVRAYRLAYLLDAAARQEEIDDEQIATLVRSVGVHLAVLADDAEFASHSNHGIYQAAGQYALALRFPDLPDTEASRDQAVERLRRLIDTQFTPEGVHREHSPQYHLLVLGTFQSVADLGLGSDPYIADMLTRAKDALAWFIQPNMRLAMFGDSGYRFSAVRSLKQSSNSAMRFALSGGKDGAPPQARAKAFPDSGYIVFRDRWPDGAEDFSDCSYLAQMCAFHSRTHKHADDLSFVWYEPGAELVSEAGRYGYLGKTEQGSPLWMQGFWYSDPHRVYVESTRAHNTVEIDGGSYNRKDAKPYGSALRRWGKSDGVYFAESTCVHVPHVQRARLLLYRTGSWVVAFDWLRDAHQIEHTYTQRFLFDCALEPEEGDSAALSIPNRPERLYLVSLLEAEPLPIVKAQTEPELLGWVSREQKEMLPAPSTGFRRKGVTAIFATLLWLGTGPPQADTAYSQSNESGRRARLRWRVGEEEHTVSFTRDGSEVTVDYSATSSC
jgi:Heparinase II/III N-terminus/Heparinase II/III-like protein